MVAINVTLPWHPGLTKVFYASPEYGTSRGGVNTPNHWTTSGNMGLYLLWTGLHCDDQPALNRNIALYSPLRKRYFYGPLPCSTGAATCYFLYLLPDKKIPNKLNPYTDVEQWGWSNNPGQSPVHPAITQYRMPGWFWQWQSQTHWYPGVGIWSAHFSGQFNDGEVVHRSLRLVVRGWEYDRLGGRLRRA